MNRSLFPHHRILGGIGIINLVSGFVLYRSASYHMQRCDSWEEVRERAMEGYVWLNLVGGIGLGFLGIWLLLKSASRRKA